MNYFEAIASAKDGKVIKSLKSGRVIRPSELGQIWVGAHWAGHNTIGLTREETGGLWAVTED